MLLNELQGPISYSVTVSYEFYEPPGNVIIELVVTALGIVMQV